LNCESGSKKGLVVVTGGPRDGNTVAEVGLRLRSFAGFGFMAVVATNLGVRSSRAIVED